MMQAIKSLKIENFYSIKKVQLIIIFGKAFPS